MRVPTFLGEGNRYKIENEIGRGGMGSVYRAEDKNTGKRVAIKIMLDGANPVAQELFDREWRILAELQHPNIIGITDKGDFPDEGTRYPFFVMPFLKGRNLLECIRSVDDPPSVEKVISIISAVADSLHAAHTRGIIHRDVKPGNIFVLESGPVVVIDFGVVHLVDNRSGTTIKGTTLYMAPELLVPAKNENPSAASDQFSLGVVCYEALTGKHPFARSNERDTRQAILNEIPAPAFEVNQNLSLVLSQVVQKSMAKDWRHRFSTVKEFAEKLERAYRSEPLPEFDRNTIENKLRVVRDALSRGQATSAHELMRSIEEDGFIDPAISNQRQKIDQALRQKWIREQLESANLYREANQQIAALEKLNDILRKAPDCVDAQRERDSIQEERYNNLLNEARSQMSRHLFALARAAIQDAASIKPSDPHSAELLEEVRKMESADRDFAERKTTLYQAAQKAQRDGLPGVARRKLEELMEMIRLSPLSNPERDPIYKSFYEVMVEESNRLSQASQDVRNHLSSGRVSDAIEICEQMLAANPGNSVFEALRLEAENQEQQTRMNFVSRTRTELENVLDLDERVKLLHEAVDLYPNESQLTGLLKGAKAKRDFVSGLLSRARNAEVPGRYSVALELWHDIKSCHPSFAGIDDEIQRVEKLCEMEVREDRRGRLVQEIAKLLRTGQYDKAADRSDNALAEFPADAELLARQSEARESALRAPEVQSLVSDGRRLLQEGNLDAALETLRNAERLDPNSPQARQLLGAIVLDKAKAALAAGNLIDAGRLFNEAHTLNPDNPDAKSGIAELSRQDHTESVEECLAAALQLSESGNLNGALDRIERSLKIYPGENRLLTELARIHQSLGQSTTDPNNFTSMETGLLSHERRENRESMDAQRAEQSEMQSGSPGARVRPFRPPQKIESDEKRLLAELARIRSSSNNFSSVDSMGQETDANKPASLETGLSPEETVSAQGTGLLEPKHSSRIHKLIYVAALIIVLAAGLSFYLVRKNGQPPPIVPASVPIDIASVPEGANISINGQKPVSSKIHQQLNPGDFDVEVSLAGYETIKEKITLTTSPLNRVFTLVPLPMDLQIITPSNAKGKVWLDNEPKGDLPVAGGIVIPGITAGMHDLKIEAEGRGSISATFELSPGNPPRPSAKPPKEKAVFLFVGSFNGKLWAECSCPAGSKVKLADVVQPIDSAGVELNQTEGEQPLVLSAGGTDRTLTIVKSPNPSATVAVYWPSTPSSTVQPVTNSFDKLYKQATEFANSREYDKALSAVTLARKNATDAQNLLLDSLEKKIQRDKRIQ